MRILISEKVMSPTPPLEWVKTPRQARSQETLERILEAAEELLLEKEFETIAVTEIAKRARSSVGALYARFADKEALLRCLLERFHAQAVDTVWAALAPERWEEATAEEFLEASMRFLIRVFRERRHFVTACARRAAEDGEVAEMGQRLGELVAERLEALLSRRDEGIGHPNPVRAIRLCVWLIMSAFESRAVFAPRPELSDAALAAEVAALCRGYLQLGGGASGAGAAAATGTG